MLALITKNSKLNKVAMAALLSFIAANVNAVNTIDEDLDIDSRIDIINDVIDEAYSDIYIPNGVPSGIPEGTNFEVDDYTDEEGYHLNMQASARFKQDFGEFVNTSSKNITIMNVTAGASAGASLGCNGLDMGAEALLNFDAGNILKYLPKYITTKLASEALVQIYATPLISAVMDGLKAMQNFTAEFTQASCNMADVKSRASEVRKARIQECIDENTYDGMALDDQEAVMAKCEDPGELTRQIKAVQDAVSNRESTGYSLSKLATEKGVPYGGDIPMKTVNGKQVVDTSHPDYISSGLTWGAVTQALIPDVRISVNGGSVNEPKRAQLDAGDVFNRASNTAYNTLLGTYNDAIATMNNTDIPNIKYRKRIMNSMQQYKVAMLKYGTVDIYSDDDDKNTQTRTPEEINTIKEYYGEYASVAYATPRSYSGFKLFQIGPEEGPNGTWSSMVSDFKGDGRSVFLNAADSCFVKLYEEEGNTSGNYKWVSLQHSPEAILSSDKINSSSISDGLIDQLATCKALNIFNYALAKETMDTNQALGLSYMQSIAANAALDATSSIINLVGDKITYMVVTEPYKLEKQCQDTGGNLAELPNTYADGSGSQNGIYPDCATYVKQNKMPEEKVQYFQELQAKMRRSVDNLKIQVDAIKEEYITFQKLAIKN